MVNVPRIHCHSAYKHYQMFHWDSGSSYGNSVFNTTYNFNGGSCFGGGFMGGLWGGLGMGLGAGLMNFLFGGMGMFGGGMYGGGLWGLGGSLRGDGAGGKSKVKEKIVEKEITDRDNEVLKNLESEIQAIEKKAKEGTLTETELDAIKKKVDDESKKSDKYHKIADDAHYDLLKNRLSLIKIAQPKPVEPPVVDNTNADDALNLTLQFARHEGSKVNDEYIKGNIVGVKIGTDGKTPVGYIIDCKDGGTLNLRYEVTVSNNTYNIKCISQSHSTSSCKKTLYTPENGLAFKKEGKELVRETPSEYPLVSEYQREGYDRPIPYKINSSGSENLLPGYIKVENNETEVNGKNIKIKPEEI